MMPRNKTGFQFVKKNRIINAMKKVLLINGSPNEKGCTALALGEVASALKRRGIECDIKNIGKKPVAGCIACGSCRKTGKCVFSDSVNEILASADEYAALVVGSPVYYAGASGQVCALLDRLFFAGGGHWEGKIGACVVSCRRGGAAAAFDRLNKYFLMSNMPVAPSQYWNQIHGNSQEEAAQDAEGLQTMRTLGENIAWMMKSFDAAEKAGIGIPEREKRIYTNFIR